MRYKIVLVPFPFDDLSSHKVRPAICLTEPIGPHRHVVVAFITSRLPAEALATDLIIRTDDAEFKATGLRVSSAIQLHRLMTITTSLIRRVLGELPPPMQTQLKSRLSHLFDLSR
ncbi:MAG: type II toxin-antitoxin system PemK/MazF family toxin [Caldilineae bacterium]|nr:MAG: type II toxin-antitoxin system PemK/MazF family toxin [Caldilineae bacterium]